jgi:transketolase
MALEDLASMRAIHGSTVLYPSDAVSAAKLVGEMADTKGIVFMRTTRGAYPVIYDNADTFPVGGAKVVRQADDDKVVLIGAGVTLHNCLAAADTLAAEGINARVVDLYSLKPVDKKTLAGAISEVGKLVVAEDHYPEGGLAAAILEAMADHPDHFLLAHCAVQGLPGSGKPEELMDAAGISASHIAEAARKLVAQKL